MLVSGLASGLVVLACGQIAGLEDPPATAPTPSGTTPDAAPGSASVSVTPLEMDFGDQPCGADSAAKLLAITNTGSAAVDYRVELPAGSPFVLEGPLTGNLAAGSSAPTISVRARPDAAGATTAEVLVTAGPFAQNVKLAATGRGAALDLQPPILNIGDVRMQSGGEAVVTIANKGNEPLVIPSFSSTSDFSITLPSGGLTIAPDQSATATVTLKADTVESAPLSATLTPTVTGNVCGAVKPLDVQGRRVSLDVTISPGDFGQQPCLSQPAPKSVVISNYSGNVLNYAATLPGGSAFSIASGGSDTIPAGSTGTPATRTVVVNAPALGGSVAPLADALTITITGIAAPAGGARNVPLNIDVRGVILGVTPAQITNLKSNGTYYDVKSWTMSNTGNVEARLSWGLTRTKGDRAWFLYPPGRVSAGGNATGQVLFAPTGSCPCEAKAAYQTSDGATICNPPPVTMVFQGGYP